PEYLSTILGQYINCIYINQLEPKKGNTNRIFEKLNVYWQPLTGSFMQWRV
ncbi:hypothetical protein SAMN02927925_02794, partial [Flavobacterium saliperosum]